MATGIKASFDLLYLQALSELSSSSTLFNPQTLTELETLAVRCMRVKNSLTSSKEMAEFPVTKKNDQGEISKERVVVPIQIAFAMNADMLFDGLEKAVHQDEDLTVIDSISNKLVDLIGRFTLWQKHGVKTNLAPTPTLAKPSRGPTPSLTGRCSTLSLKDKDNHPLRPIARSHSVPAVS